MLVAPFESLAIDKAMEIVSEMEEAARLENEGVTIFAGLHPELGKIHVVIPALGDGFLLSPIVLRDV